MGDFKSRGGFPAEMSGLRPSGYDSEKTGGEEYQGTSDAGWGWNIDSAERKFSCFDCSVPRYTGAEKHWDIFK